MNNEQTNLQYIHPSNQNAIIKAIHKHSCTCGMSKIGWWINFKRKPGKGMWYKQKELLIKELQSGFKSENKSKVMFCYSNNKQMH